MSPNDADGMANSVDPDQTDPLGAVWSGSALFAQAYLSENLVKPVKAPPPPSIFILTVPRRYFCCGSLLFLLSVFILWLSYYVSDIFCKF